MKDGRTAREEQLHILVETLRHEKAELATALLRAEQRGNEIEAKLASERLQFLERDAVLPYLERDAVLPYSVLSFGTTRISAGARTIINTQPQIPFRPARLCVADNNRELRICDLKAGHNSQFVSAAPISAHFFAVKNIHELEQYPESAAFEAPRVSYDTLSVGMYATIEAHNPTDREIDFHAIYLGYCLGYEPRRLGALWPKDGAS